jgi:hypothetical protein
MQEPRSSFASPPVSPTHSPRFPYSADLEAYLLRRSSVGERFQPLRHAEVSSGAVSNDLVNIKRSHRNLGSVASRRKFATPSSSFRPPPFA